MVKGEGYQEWKAGKREWWVAESELGEVARMYAEGEFDDEWEGDMSVGWGVKHAWMRKDRAASEEDSGPDDVDMDDGIGDDDEEADEEEDNDDDEDDEEGGEGDI